MDGKWLSILEYASFKKKSISTVRRYIKANRVKHKEEGGKYFIFCKNYIDPSLQDDSLDLKLQNMRLAKENQRLMEQVAELQMLVSLYEHGHFEKKPLELPQPPINL